MVHFPASHVRLPEGKSSRNSHSPFSIAMLKYQRVQGKSGKTWKTWWSGCEVFGGWSWPRVMICHDVSWESWTYETSTLPNYLMMMWLTWWWEYSALFCPSKTRPFGSFRRTLPPGAGLPTRARIGQAPSEPAAVDLGSLWGYLQRGAAQVPRENLNKAWRVMTDIILKQWVLIGG